MSGTTLTIPGSGDTTKGGATVTLSFNNTQNSALANSIAGALHNALTIGGGLFVATVTGSGGSGTAFAKNVSGNTGELIIPAGYTGVVSVQGTDGYQYVVDLSAGSDTIFGNPTLSILGGGGNHTIVDPAAIVLGDTAAGSTNVITVSGTVGGGDNVAVGNGSNTVVGTGSGTISGGTGKNTFDVSGAATAGYVINSEGTGDSVLGGANPVTVNALALPQSTVKVGGNTFTIPGATATGGFYRAGAGDFTVDYAGVNNTIRGAAGNLVVNAHGRSVLIQGGPQNGNVTVNSSGKFAQTNYGFVGGSITETVSGTNNSVILGNGGGTVNLTSGATTAFVFNGGASANGLTVDDEGTGDVVVQQNSTAGAAVTMGGANGIGVGQGTTFDALLGGTNNQIFTQYGTSDLSATLTGSGDVAVSGEKGGSVTLTGTATGAIVAPVQAGSGVLNVLDQGSNNQLLGTYASGGTFNVTVQGSGDTIAAGPATTNVTVVGAGVTDVLNLGGNLKFVGGAGSATVEAFNFTGLPPGGGGLSGTTIFGSVDGDNILYSSLSNAGGLDYQAGLGNETLNASGSKTSDTLAAGPGNVAMTVGSGITDLLLVQSIIGGAGSVLGGASDSVSGFAGNAGNFVDIMGYASGSGAVTTVSGGSSLLTLTDGTKITFENVSSSALVAAIKYT